MPVIAKAINQLTSNQAVRAYVVITLTAVVVWQTVTGTPMNETLKTALLVAIGYYFGEITPTPSERQRAHNEVEKERQRHPDTIPDNY